METITLNNDIKVFYVIAESFPAGIKEAHEKLHALIPFSKDRRYFGISRPENGVIVYMAAAEETTDREAERLGLDTLILKKGAYISELVADYLNHIGSIDKTFKNLLKQPKIDPEGYCVEWYLNDKDMRCMVRLSV